MNKSTYGEDLLAAYLTTQGVAFEREPRLPGVSQLIDCVIDHPTDGKILLEVKDIWNPMPASGYSTFDPYKAIREHIEEGTRKFKFTAHYVCGLVLAAPPGSFVHLNDPNYMLGAMYGDFGYRVPFDPEGRGSTDEEMTMDFLVGRGKMVRPTKNQNTRIAALISIREFAVWNLAMRKYINTDDGRTKSERINDVYNGTAGLPDDTERETGITVWENAIASKKFPRDLFRGAMDARYEVSEDHQSLAFTGERRRLLGVDDQSL